MSDEPWAQQGLAGLENGSSVSTNSFEKAETLHRNLIILECFASAAARVIREIGMRALLLGKRQGCLKC